MDKARHVLGISGGKDSAALAIYLHKLYPHLDIEYYCCDTEKELEETYQVIDRLEEYLGKRITRLKAVEDTHVEQFDYFLRMYGGYLPSSNARWCTQRLKLVPFERFVSTDPVISYVGIREDENREAYISSKENIQSIFPFRKNIWSGDVIDKVLNNSNKEFFAECIRDNSSTYRKETAIELALKPITPSFQQKRKLSAFHDLSIIEFNQAVFKFLKTTNYPLALEDDFPLLNNDEGLIRADIFRMLEESGVGVPEYYKKITFTVDGETGEYARSRSGCYFCFFQQKIEWVWLYEQHPDLFAKAMEYEKDGYTWMQGESLLELTQSERITQIKRDIIKRSKKNSKQKSNLLIDLLDDTESVGCAACFI